MVFTDLFYVDTTTQFGIFVVLVIIALATFLFFKRSFIFSALLCWLCGFIFYESGLGFILGTIPVFIGIMIIVGGRGS